MINSKLFLEKLLQDFRFAKVKDVLVGDVLDFGGNEGEIKKYVKGNYTIVNYDHSPMEGKEFDVIVLLAVIEHIEIAEVYKIFAKLRKVLRPNGKLYLTTPTKNAKGVLELLASLHILDKQNIEEHKHYWSKEDIFNLATENTFKVLKYEQFQLGFNQFAILT